MFVIFAGIFHLFPPGALLGAVSEEQPAVSQESPLTS
jgi:hypothetical protein